MDYEKNTKRIEEIITLLESGECSLNQTVELFDEASKLSNECAKFLNETKGKILEIKQTLGFVEELPLL